LITKNKISLKNLKMNLWNSLLLSTLLVIDLQKQIIL